MKTNSFFVSINCQTGEFNRYEAGGERPRLTHEALITEGAELTAGMVEMLRTNPPDHLRVQARVVIPFVVLEARS